MLKPFSCLSGPWNGTGSTGRTCRPRSRKGLCPSRDARRLPSVCPPGEGNGGVGGAFLGTRDRGKRAPSTRPSLDRRARWTGLMQPWLHRIRGRRRVGDAQLPAAARALRPAHHPVAAAQRLGVVQLSDGLVALPADARTREQLEWPAEDVARRRRGGRCLARPADDGRPGARAGRRDVGGAGRRVPRAGRRLPRGGRRRAGGAVPGAAPPARGWRAIGRRDFFPPPERDEAGTALRELDDAPRSGPGDGR